MASSFEWIVPLFLGLCFMFLGGLRLYGFCMGYEGGPQKSLWERLCAGTCPEEHCKLPQRLRIPFYLLLCSLFLGLGLYCLMGFWVVVSR